MVVFYHLSSVRANVWIVFYHVSSAKANVWVVFYHLSSVRANVWVSLPPIKKSDASSIFIWILIYVLYKLHRTVLQLQRTVISPDNSVDLSCHRVYRDTELSIFYTGNLGRFESILLVLIFCNSSKYKILIFKYEIC